MEEEILFYAFRYALGRRTHAVDTVAKSLIKHGHIFQKSTRELVVAEIRDAEERKTIGDKCDRESWNKVIAAFAKLP